jgi:arsenate reductase
MHRETPMTNARLYHNADCSKCRSALALLVERGIDVEVVSYLDQPPSLDELRALLRRLDQPARSLLRVAEGDPTAAALAASHVGDETILAALAADPRRLQRPVLVVGDRAVIARPPERVLEII